MHGLRPHWIRVPAASLLAAAALLAGCPSSDDDAAASADTSADSGGTAGTGGTSVADGGPGPDDGGPGPSTADTTVGTTPGDATEGTDDTATATGSTDDGPPETCGGASMCIAAAPADWTGPVSYRDLQAGMENDCIGAYPDAIDDLSFEVSPVGAPADCMCSCGAPSGTTCDERVLHYASAACGGAATTVNLPTLNSCVNINPNSSHAGWDLQGNPQGGSCTPSSSESTTPVTFESTLRVCGANVSQADCAADEVCAPIPAAPLPPGVCIAREGDFECPADTPYTVRSQFFTSFVDGRTCGPACTCGDVTGAACTGATATLYRDTEDCTAGGTCANPPCVEYLTQGCDAVGVTLVRSLRRTANATLTNAGMCPPNPYTPTGEVTPADPVTLCCTM